MVSLDLHDVITHHTRRAHRHQTSTGPFADGVPARRSNLVAADCACRLGATDRRPAARHRLDKRIPHGGGLGGGSADAAAVLRWAGYGSIDADALERASQLGADIAFCLVGGRARVRGIGEIVEPLATSSARSPW